VPDDCGAKKKILFKRAWVMTFGKGTEVALKISQKHFYLYLKRKR